MGSSRTSTEMPLSVETMVWWSFSTYCFKLSCIIKNFYDNYGELEKPISFPDHKSLQLEAGAIVVS